MNELDVTIGLMQKLERDIVGLIDAGGESGWIRRPAEREWNVAQVIDHINTVNGLLAPRISAAVEQAQASGGPRASGPFRYPLFDRMFVLGMEPRQVLKQKAPRVYRPEDEPRRAESREAFIKLHRQVLACAEASRGLDLVKIKIASPAYEWWKFSLGTWFKAVRVHEENHYRQAARILGDRQFY